MLVVACRGSWRGEAGGGGGVEVGGAMHRWSAGQWASSRLFTLLLLSFAFSNILENSSLQLFMLKYLLPELQLLSIGLEVVGNRFERAFNARSWWIDFITSSASDSWECVAVWTLNSSLHQTRLLALD